MNTFLLPDLGEGLTEAEIVRWLVAVGDVVSIDQAVVEVETAKSVVELPSPFAGRIAALHGAEGSAVEVGKQLFSVEPAGASGNVLVGYGTPAAVKSGRRRRPRTNVAAPAAAVHKVPRVASPLVRKLARDGGVDVADIDGTGPDGLVTRADVVRVLQHGSSTPGPPASSSGERRIPLTGFRKAVSAALTRSRSEIPEATVWVDVDATELWRLRESTRTPEDPGPGILAYLACFTVRALRRHPVFNSRLDGDHLVELEDVNLGVATHTPRGLMVPAVPRAQDLTLAGLNAEIRRVTSSARDDGTVKGTFTLNNYGSFNVDGSAAIINHPQVAILGFGRMIERPWVVAGEITIRRITQMSFVFDHRVADGGEAAAFMRAVADAIENPLSAIVRL